MVVLTDSGHECSFMKDDLLLLLSVVNILRLMLYDCESLTGRHMFFLVSDMFPLLILYKSSCQSGKYCFSHLHQSHSEIFDLFKI